MKDLYC